VITSMRTNAKYLHSERALRCITVHVLKPSEELRAADAPLPTHPVAESHATNASSLKNTRRVDGDSARPPSVKRATAPARAIFGEISSMRVAA